MHRPWHGQLMGAASPTRGTLYDNTRMNSQAREFFVITQGLRLHGIRQLFKQATSPLHVDKGGKFRSWPNRDIIPKAAPAATSSADASDRGAVRQCAGLERLGEAEFLRLRFAIRPTARGGHSASLASVASGGG